MEVRRSGRCAYKSIRMAYLGVLLSPEQARALLFSSNFSSAVNPFQVLDPADKKNKKKKTLGASQGSRQSSVSWVQTEKLAFGKDARPFPVTGQMQIWMEGFVGCGPRAVSIFSEL